MPSFTTKSTGGVLHELRSDVDVFPFSPKGELINGQRFVAIWDTGATSTAVSPQLAATLGLIRIDQVVVNTAGGSKLSPVYLANIGLPNTQVMFQDVRVTEAELTNGVDVLIGMDIITAGDFSVTNDRGNTWFSFRIPHGNPIDWVPGEQKRMRRNSRNLKNVP